MSNEPQPKMIELYHRIGSEAFSRLIHVERTLLCEPQFKQLTVLPYDPHFIIRV